MQPDVAVQEAVQTFEQNAVRSRRTIISVYEENPTAFLARCVPTLRNGVDSPGGQFLVAYLLGLGVLREPVCSGQLLTTAEAGAVLRVAKRVDPTVDINWIRELSCENNMVASLARLLEVLVESSRSSRLLPLLTQMLRHPDRFVQSKAALLIGRLTQNAQWVRERLEDPDPRVQANVIEGLWGEQDEEAKQVFRDAQFNQHSRVRGNAAVGLYLAGDPESLAQILTMAKSSDANERATGLWAIGYTADPRFLPFLAEQISRAGEGNKAGLFAAIRAARQRRDTTLANRSLRIHVSAATRTVEGLRRIRFSVVTTDHLPMDTSRLLATHVHVAEDGHNTFDYSVAPLAPPAAIHVGILIPAALREDIGDNLSTLTGFHRPADHWGCAWYGPGQRSIECRYTKSQDDIKRSLTDSNATCALDAGLINLFSAAAHHRQILLVGAESTSLPDLNGMLERAKAASATVHTLLPDATGQSTVLQFEALARETGGFALRRDSDDQIVSQIENVLGSILASVDLEYRPSHDDDNDFPETRIQIFSPLGHAEATTFLRVA